MDTIERKLQEMKEEAMNECINRVAMHEAGHVVMLLLLMREAPYHIVLTPETGAGVTVSFHLPDSPTERALSTMAGYAAEKLYDPLNEETSLGDYMYHNDCDNQDFLDLFRNPSGKLTAGVYEFELKVFDCAVEMLKTCWPLIVSLADELKNAEGMEMDYNAIKKFCREYQEAFPLLKGISFTTPTAEELADLRESLDEYRTEQKNALLA